MEKIANYIFPGNSESQLKLRKTAIEEGLKYIIKEQVIYYQRPLKPQTELVGNCRFEKEEKALYLLRIHFSKNLDAGNKLTTFLLHQKH